jgi:hypothetical protein
MSFVFVALGGALGAVTRYAISLIPVKTQFPILTLVTNILGAILIGFIVGITDKKADVSPNTVLFWKTGVCDIKCLLLRFRYFYREKAGNYNRIIEDNYASNFQL